MKKNFLPLIVVIILVLGAGYFYLSQNKSSSRLPIPSKKESQTKPEEKKENKLSTFSSLKEALTGNRSVKCEFTDDQGRKTTMYFKNNLARGIYQGTEEMGNFLYRDE